MATKKEKEICEYNHPRVAGENKCRVCGGKYNGE
tara:strand:- start:326 stop:427 length:102 start_codon:yes stop_codon:yes gene_type:complete